MPLTRGGCSAGTQADPFLPRGPMAGPGGPHRGTGQESGTLGDGVRWGAPALPALSYPPGFVGARGRCRTGVGVGVEGV